MGFCHCVGTIALWLICLNFKNQDVLIKNENVLFYGGGGDAALYIKG